MPAVLIGQIRWADLNPVQGHEQAGRRPVLVISSSASNARSQLAIILPITSSPRRVPLCSANHIGKYAETIVVADAANQNRGRRQNRRSNRAGV